jgi:molybdopterin-guanine dinucleotide biosynthesis protein A
MPAPLTVAILAGGGSSRMGVDKTGLEIDGITLLDHVLAAAGDLPVVVVGRSHSRVTSIPDPAPIRRGPLAGLVAALDACGGPVLLVGADQPWLRPATLQALAAAAATDLPTAPVDGGVRQVLCAVYPATVLVVARSLLEAGRGPQAVLDLGCAEITAEVWQGWGEDGRSWFSVNTAAALDEGLRRYGRPR